MSQPYLKYLEQSYLKHFPDTSFPFDLRDFLQTLIRQKLSSAIDDEVDVVLDATIAMHQENPVIACQFVEDCFPFLGLNLSWHLAHLLKLDVDAEVLAGRLDDLAKNMTEFDVAALKLPQKIFSSSIFIRRELRGLVMPGLNPLLLKMVLNVQTQKGVQSIEDFLRERPLEAEHLLLIEVSKGYRSELDDRLGADKTLPNWISFFNTLVQMEADGLVDSDALIAKMREDRSIGGQHQPLIRAFYEPEHANHMAGALLSCTGCIPTPASIKPSQWFTDAALDNILNADHGDDLALEMIKNAILAKPDSAKLQDFMCERLLRAVLKPGRMDSHELQSFLASLHGRLKAHGASVNLALKNKKDAIFKTLFAPASAWESVSDGDTYLCFAKSIAGVSNEVRCLLGDLACLSAKEFAEPVVTAERLHNLVADGMVSASHIKRMVRSEKGRQVCASANLPIEIIDQLPRRFLDNQMSADLGL